MVHDEEESNGNKGTSKSQLCENAGGTNNNNNSGNVQSGGSKQDDALSPSRFFTDDASDIIGRFFFGMPIANNPSNVGIRESTAITHGSGVGGVQVGGVKKGGLISSPSFGSASSLSTMTSGVTSTSVVGKGRGGGNAGTRVQEQLVGGSGANNEVPDVVGDNINTNLDSGVYALGWDQDEIDLWTGPSSRAPAVDARRTKPHTPLRELTITRGGSSTEPSSLVSRRENTGESTSRKDGMGEESQDDWVGRRRQLLERRKKRQNWDALGAESVGSDTSAVNREAKGERACDLVPPREMSDVSLVSGANTLLLTQAIPLGYQQQHQNWMALPDREPATNDGSNQESEKRAKPKGGAVIIDDGKQHWMPDNLCKQCYSCEAPFSLLRRKHHCRLCGMIFCSSCSAYFVQITSLGSTSNASKGQFGTMRCCKMCHDHLSERGLGVMMRGVNMGRDAGTSQAEVSPPEARKSPLLTKNSSGGEFVGKAVEPKPEPGTASAPPLTSKSSARDILLPLASTNSQVSTEKDLDQPQPITSSELSEQFTGLEGSPGSTGEFQALSITKQRLDEDRRRREEEERAEAEEIAAAALADAAMAETQQSGGSMLKSRLGSVRQLKWKSSSNLEPKKIERDGKNAKETIKADSNAVEVSVGAGFRHTRSDSRLPTIETDGVVRENRSGMEEAVLEQGQNKDAALSAKIHLGMVAADYLEKLGRELLQSDAPRLLKEIKESSAGTKQAETKLTNTWVNTLMTLSTRCCATVEPDVKNGDLLDIRPYCKVKVIPGGSVEDYAYISGVAFHKNVTDKKMARVINNAKIMLLSGGVEFTRSENRVSLDALLEQEERYMEILVTKIFKLQPNVLLVGRSVSRKAQELLLRANVALVQYVKPALMTRIARQTGATVLSSIDHVINQPNSILGHCRRFRLVAFRDNDVWIDGGLESKQTDPSDKVVGNEAKQINVVHDQKSVSALLSQSLPNHERQAVLAARKLGESVLDGNDAVRTGLAKRGVVKTYVMIEGCPKELGCTVILRGASRPALKEIKRVLRFLINAAYNMKLETCYLLERCSRLPPSYTIPSTPCSSSSLCVDFGQPPRKVRPWNGSQKGEGRSISGKITPFDHQAILITSVWMTDKTQCCPAEVKGICYYSLQDVSLGQFLRDSCFNLSLKCQNPSCKK